MFVANFVVQLDYFWTARRYFNKLYFIDVCVKVFLILVFSFCRLNICCSYCVIVWVRVVLKRTVVGD